MAVMDIARLAPALTQDAEGIWRAARHGHVDYPDEANAFCFAVEEQSFWFAYRNRFIVAAVRNFPPAGPIADIGAGNGFVSLGLQRAGFPTIVIEPGPAGARNARSRGLDPVICATLGEAAFAPGSLDAAGVFDVLEHIEDDRGFLRTLHDVLAPGGRLYVTVPAFQALWSSEDDLVGHHRRYSIKQLSDCLQATGFAVDYATYLFAPLPLPLFLLRTLASRLGRRTTLDPARTAAELKPPSGLAVRAINFLLDREVKRIERRRSMWTGTSCLVVARSD
jgi:SAM-dependent methyltransferase